MLSPSKANSVVNADCLRQLSDLCLNSLIKVFRADSTGDASLEIVRLLNRMIKERKFNVHPDVLSCLLHLRLKTELGVRASETKADKERPGKAHPKKGKGKKADQPHLSKKAKKVLKERKEIEKEMREAEAEVDKEERAAKVELSASICVIRLGAHGNHLTANGDAQIALCPLFPDPQASHADTAASRGSPRNLQILAFGQHRFLP